MDDNGGQHHHGKLEVSRPMAALFGIGFTFVLLAIIHLIYVGWCKNTTRTAPSEIRTRALHQPEPSPPPPSSSGVSDGSRLQLIVTMRYGKERKEEECVVCLSQFIIGEEVRVLVRCGHVFHVACIDMWLCSHPTCPICRVNTVAGIR